MLSIEALRARMAESPFIHFCGMQLVSRNERDGALTIVMPFKQELQRGPGSDQFHGGPIAALIDTAACFALVQSAGESVPTVNFRTDFLRPAVNTSLTA